MLARPVIRMVSASLSHAPNNRYVNDEQIAQRRWRKCWKSHAGIATKVDAMPSSVYFARAANSNSGPDAAGLVGRFG